jgi:hypothetical protein
MAKKTILNSTMTAIADSVRSKTGSTGLLTPNSMIQAIKALPSGGALDFSDVYVSRLIAKTGQIYDNTSLGQFLTLAKYLTGGQLDAVFTDYDADITIDGSVYDITKVYNWFSVSSEDSLTAIREYVVINPALFPDSNYSYDWIIGYAGIANGGKVNLTLKNVVMTSKFQQPRLGSSDKKGTYNKLVLDGFTRNFTGMQQIPTFAIYCSATEMVIKNLDFGDYPIGFAIAASLSIDSLEVDLSKFGTVIADNFGCISDISKITINGAECTSFQSFASWLWTEDTCNRIWEFTGLETTNNLNCTYCFQSNKKLTTFDLTRVKGGSGNALDYMFQYCSNLASVGSDTIELNGSSFNSMFQACSKLVLKKVTFNNSISTVRNMFWNCTSLTEIHAVFNQTSSGTFQQFLNNCTGLKKITLEFNGTWCNVNLANDTTMGMLYYCANFTDFTLIIADTVSTATLTWSTNSDTVFSNATGTIDLSGVKAGTFIMPVSYLVGPNWDTEHSCACLPTILFPEKVVYDMQLKDGEKSGVGTAEGVASNFVKTYGGQSKTTLQTLTFYIPQSEYNKLTEAEITNFTSNGGVLEVVA